jgi:hypothetical protein
MALTNNQRIGRALELVAAGLGPFVDRMFSRRFGADWPSAVSDRVPANAKADTYFLLRAMTAFWREGFAETLGRTERSWAGELADIRNKWAHNEVFSSDQTLRALDTAQLLLNAVSAGEQAAEVDRMRQELLRAKFAEEARQVRRRAVAVATEGQPKAGLKPWREVVTPHPDVASGRYQQAEFAADLHQVWRDEATPEYGRPEEFFRRTYLTEGLRRLLLNAAWRLRGEGGDPVVELQTNFGGGKTHSLIALYHLAQGYPPSQLFGIEDMLAQAGVDPPPAANIAVLVGQMIRPAQVLHKPDGTRVHTLWGELAYQLGGREAYDEFVAEDDRRGTNPGEALIDLFGYYAPCLVLIDEWVAYARQLYGVDGLPAGSFDTQFTFAQALTDAARRVPNALLVVSIPASDIEVGGEGGREALKRLHNVVSRMEASWKPATADEGFEIVRRRLFDDIPPNLERERDAVVRSFSDLYRAQRGEFPPECREGGYERRLRASYPIHPELFDRLYGEWSTLERFQRTRGVLRLMAGVIHELWEQNDRSLLILPGSLPVYAGPVMAELTRHLDEAWTPVIGTDIDGENSLPLRLDRENPGTFGRYSAARRVAHTVFMGSAPVAEAANRGIDDRRIKLGCVQPGESPATFGDALRRLSNRATYLNTDGQRYWYSLQQTVTRLAADRAGLIPEDRVEDEIRQRLRRGRERGDFASVHAAPLSPGDVHDEASARLVILGPEHSHSPKTQASPARDFAVRILDERAGGPRVHRNMLVFLAPDTARLEELREAVRQFRAWRSIQDEKDSLNLDTVQRAQTDARAKEWDDSVSQRIHEAYQWLLVPAASKDDSTVRWEATRVSGSEPLPVLASRKLRTEEGLIVKYSGARLRMDLDRIPLWRGDHVAVRQLWSDYAQYLYLPRLRDASILADAVRDGVALLTWESDAFAYADGWIEGTGRYVGLRAGEHVDVSPDAGGLVVKSDVARRQLEEEAQARGRVLVDGTLGRRFTVEVEKTKPEQERDVRPRRFYGSVTLDPVRLSRDAGQIAEAIVQHLTGLVGSKVDVRLEVQADIPDGAPDDVVRTVTENARTLRFDSHGFERE